MARMPGVETQIVDATARIVLPQRFAETRVVLEEISETEVRVRKTGGSDEAQAESSAQERTPAREAFHRALITTGTVKRIKPARHADDILRCLIQVQGKPVSETIIEERR
jgi:hypothetical protein